MGGKGSGSKGWSEEQKEAKTKAPEERRTGKTLSFYLNDLVKLQSASDNLGISQSDYVRTLIHRDENESLTKIAIEIKNYYEIQEKNIEELEEQIEEIKREQKNLLSMLKRLGITIQKK
jgi:CTP-dependent riboflavin kinase